MSINTTDRAVNLPQLGRELQVAADLDEPPGLSTRPNPDGSGLMVICHDERVSMTLLDQVIDAHVPESPKTVPTVEELAQLLDETLDLIFTEVL